MFSNKRNLDKFQCPGCGIQKLNSNGRVCENCSYVGDWIQPGEVMTYAENKKYLGVGSIADFLEELRHFHVLKGTFEE